MSKITSIKALQILDSRGIPTIEVEIQTEKKACGRASAPSGISVGSNECLEVRDNIADFYDGKSVLNNIHYINNTLNSALCGINVEDQKQIDELLIQLDATKNKAVLGTNTIVAVSVAAIKTAAIEANLPLYRYLNNATHFTLPIPMINVINGGRHAVGTFDFQEFMIVPVGAKTFCDALRSSAEVFYSIRKLLVAKKMSTTTGDEGGFAPPNLSNYQALDLIMEAIELASYKPGKDFSIAIDVAASEFYDPATKTYSIKNENFETEKLTSQEMVKILTDIAKNYPLYSIEDGLAEGDHWGWQELSKNLSGVLIVGDDLFCTKKELLLEGIKNKLANSILLKINQIGTLTETLEVIKTANQNNITTILSHRSGETEDASIADFAVGFNLKRIKAGGLSRIDRIAKYNQLLRIENELQADYTYAGIL